MTAVVKPNISSEIAKIYRAAIESQTTNAYFFLGKVTSWEDSDLGGSGIYDDASPPPPRTSQSYEVETRRNIISLQKAGISNTSLAIRRYDWSAGTVYDMYDPRYSNDTPAPSGATNLAESNMFVLTDDFNLYKCIYNNEGAASTVKPTGTGTDYIALSDGYVWKFMKSISINERNQFLSTNFVPVSDVVDGGFFDGEIGFAINSGGSGYAGDNTILTVSGDGSGADLEAVVTSGSISNVIVKNGGTGYTTAIIDITTPDSAKAQGTGADIDAVINQISTQNSQTDVQLAAVDGEISIISISNGGTGYTTATATITGDGSGANVTPIITGGVITGFTYTNRGSGYNNATVTITGDGSGFQGEVILAPTNGHGFSLVNESFPVAIAAYVSGLDEQVQGFDITADYRQLGIVLNPIRYNENNVSNYVEKVTSASATPCYLFTNSNILAANYTTPEKVLDSDNNEYVVVEVQDGSMVLQALSDVEPAGGVSLITQTVPATTVVVDSDGQITNPTFDRSTGSILYIDNRIPFNRGTNQIINLRTFLEF